MIEENWKGEQRGRESGREGGRGVRERDKRGVGNNEGYIGVMWGPWERGFATEGRQREKQRRVLRTARGGGEGGKEG